MELKTANNSTANRGKRPGPWTKGPGQRDGKTPGGSNGGAPNRGGSRGTGGPGGKRPHGKFSSEFSQKIIDIRRVARVVAGGRRFSFSVVVVVGDKKGKVGVGIGKAGDTALAIEKAVTSGKKNMVSIRRTKEGSIPHETEAKYSSARVVIMPAPGRGLVAGSSVRSVLDLAGVTNVTAKLRSGTKNKLNNAKAAILALSRLSAPRGEKVAVEEKKEEVVPVTE